MDHINFLSKSQLLCLFPSPKMVKFDNQLRIRPFLTPWPPMSICDFNTPERRQETGGDLGGGEWEGERAQASHLPPPLSHPLPPYPTPSPTHTHTFLELRCAPYLPARQPDDPGTSVACDVYNLDPARGAFIPGRQGTRSVLGLPRPSYTPNTASRETETQDKQL